MAKSTKRSEPVNDVPIHVLFGKDEFLRSQTMRALIKSLVGDADESMTLAMLDGETVGLVDVLDECRTPSLLAPRRVICVRNADGLFAKDEDSDSKGGSAKPAGGSGGGKSRGKAASRALSNRELLEKYLSKPCSTGVLILECKSWPKSTRLYKLVEQIGRNVDCEPPKGGDVEAWVRQHAREAFGCSLPGDSAARLVELVGEVTGLLHMELSKLATYVAPKKEIPVGAVEALVGETRTEIVFKLMDAITCNDGPGALKLWQQVLAGSRSAEFMALGGLRFAFERLYNMKRMAARGASAWDIKSALKIWDPNNLVPRQLARFSIADAENSLRTLLRIDLGAKSGLGRVDGTVEKMIVELCAAG